MAFDYFFKELEPNLAAACDTLRTDALGKVGFSLPTNPAKLGYFTRLVGGLSGTELDKVADGVAALDGKSIGDTSVALATTFAAFAPKGPEIRDALNRLRTRVNALS
jgi:hypothetical protein